MNSAPAQQLVRRFFEDALSCGDWDVLDVVAAEDYVEHEIVPGLPPVRDSLKRKYNLLRAGHPDLTFIVDDIFAADDRVVARVTVRGRNSLPFMGRPASGREFAADKVSIFRVAGGRIVEHWGVFDQMAMLAQLGALGPG